MDSALCIHYGALPLPSTKSLTMVPRLIRSDFIPSSLSLSSNVCKRSARHRHAFNPVISGLNKCSTPPADDRSDDKKLAVRRMGSASLVLACVLGMMNCSNRFTPRAIAAPRVTPPRTQSSDTQDMIFPRSAKDALKSLLMVNENVAKCSPAKWKVFHKKIKRPANPSMQDCENFKVKAARLIKAGLSDEAEKQVREIYDALVSEGKTEPAYHVQMALVAILIFEGKYKEASNCDCLKKDKAIMSDGRVYLYKAIIHTMLDENKEAKECWEIFIGSLDNDDLPHSPGSKRKNSPRVF